MSYSSGKFSIDEVGFIQTASTEVLAAIARGELDLNRIAREELAFRGADQHGRWVGFSRARKIHNIDFYYGPDRALHASACAACAAQANASRSDKAWLFLATARL